MTRPTVSTPAPPGLYDCEALSIDGRPSHFSTRRGNVLLIVNTASRCGFTPQLAGLQSLWEAYGERGLVVVGFPCNQFGAQEPGANAEIAAFCASTHGVSFPLMARVEVNGSGAHPLWAWLQQAVPPTRGTASIKWNFTKFLVARDARVVRRYEPAQAPESLRPDIEAALAA